MNSCASRTLPTAMTSSAHLLIAYDYLRKLRVSKRQAQVACLSMIGMSRSEIAEELGVSPAAVHTHKNLLYKKINASNPAELCYKYFTKALGKR